MESRKAVPQDSPAGEHLGQTGPRGRHEYREEQTSDPTGEVSEVGVEAVPADPRESPDSAVQAELEVALREHQTPGSGVLETTHQSTPLFRPVSYSPVGAAPGAVSVDRAGPSCDLFCPLSASLKPS